MPLTGLGAAVDAGTKLQLPVYGEKQQFLLKNMGRTGAADAPKYPREAVETIEAGSPRDVVLAEFVDTLIR